MRPDEIIKKYEEDNPKPEIIKKEKPKLEIVKEYLTPEEEKEYDELEEVIDTHTTNVLKSAIAIGEALDKIKKKGFFKKCRSGSDLFFRDFGDYVKWRFKRGKTMGYHYLNVHNVISTLEEGNFNPDELGSITNALVLHKEVRTMFKGEKLDQEQVEDYTRKITLLGWQAVVDTAPRDEANRLAITPESIQNTFQTIKEILNTGSVEIDGEQIPISVASVGFQEQATTALYEQVKRRKLSIYNDSEDARRKRFKEKPAISVPNFDKVKKIFVVYCPIHGEVAPKALTFGGFKSICGCYAMIEVLTTERCQFVWTQE